MIWEDRARSSSQGSLGYSTRPGLVPVPAFVVGTFGHGRLPAWAEGRARLSEFTATARDEKLSERHQVEVAVVPVSSASGRSRARGGGDGTGIVVTRMTAPS